MKIISGGQTGADRGGLDAAIELGIEHGGWCPWARKAEDGVIPSHYNLIETRSTGYAERTRLNVIDSHVTLIFIKGDKPTGGSTLTASYCKMWMVPHLVINVFGPFQLNLDGLVGFIQKYKPSVINVAGNRESKAPGIRDRVHKLLRVAIEALKEV